MTRTAGRRDKRKIGASRRPEAFQIETLAKVLQEQDAASRDSTVLSWNDLPDITKDVWREEARKFQAVFVGVMTPED